jgi:hypothetical protein
VKRRSFLIAGAALVATAAGAGLSRLFRRREPAEPPEPVSATPSSIFSAQTRPVLLAVADVIVPRYGEHPAASEIDLIPRLERWVNDSAIRLRVYRKLWPGFAAEIRRRVPFSGDRPETEALIPLFEDWYEAYRTPANRDVNAHFFEQLRRDVLRLYYASPAGWASVGYTGPVMRTHPMGDHHP